MWRRDPELKRRYPTLSYYLGTYLGEDWPEDYGDPRRAAEDFLSDQDDVERAQLVDELREFLCDHPTAEARYEATRRMGSYYAPPDPEPVTELLEWLLARAERPSG